MLWIILAVVAGVLFYTVTRTHKYWTNKGIPQHKQFPLLGDFYGMTLRMKSFGDTIKDLYNDFPNEKVCGIYQFLDPILLIRDPDLIKQVTVKDFDHFTDHRQVFPENSEPIWTKNLSALTGTKWRDMRATLSPSFTSSKMKMMYTLMSDCAEDFVGKLYEDSKKIKEREMKDLCTRFANDVIATTAFGIKTDSYVDKTNEFYVMGKNITDFSGLIKSIKFSLIVFLPKVAQILRLRFFSYKATQYFINSVRQTIKVREEQNIVRPDMIHLLMEARKGRVVEEKATEADTGFATVDESEIGKAKKIIRKEELTDMDICAQAMIFFFAGFDIVSTMMCFMAHELAVNPDVQDRLRAEIDKTSEECNGKITYEALMKMKYMDMVVSEVLRIWPNAVATDRRCTKPYTLKYDGKSVDIPANGLIFLPIIGIHKDPKYYPNPDRFDPERFSDENKHKINPYTYLPFGVGPRNCIGSRFALLEVKILFFHILSKMEFVPNHKTLIPMKISKNSFALLADPGFFLDMIPRRDRN